MVSPEERDCYFYTKSIRALSKLSFERLQVDIYIYIYIYIVCTKENGLHMLI